jgi:hypothetical protein
VKQLRLSSIQEVQTAAYGIIWKLEEEEKFTKTSEQRKTNPSRSVIPSPTMMPQMPPQMGAYSAGFSSSNSAVAGFGSFEPSFGFLGSIPTNYHMMISYCWDNKPLCRTIYERFQKDGYQVWIDESQMFGSIIERMAEGIENSEFILMCMSSSYKKSLNCQAEAEYAFKRKKKIVPLMLELRYKADGWLGLIAGSKIYINFADKVGEEFEKAYEMLLTELQHNGLKLIEPVTNPSAPVFTLPGPTQPISTESGSILSTILIKYSEAGEQSAFENLQQEPVLHSSQTSFRATDAQNAEENAHLIVTINENQSKMQSVNVLGRSAKRKERPTINSAVQIYRPIRQMNNCSEEDIIKFVVDNDLNSFLPILKGIDGSGLVELRRMYECAPETLYKMIMDKGETITLGIFFKFIGILKSYLALVEQNDALKVDFGSDIENESHNISQTQDQNDQNANIHIHPDVICNGCGMTPIKGDRYICLRCPHVNFCQLCKSTSKTNYDSNHSSNHILLCIKDSSEYPKSFNLNKTSLLSKA